MDIEILTRHLLGKAAYHYSRLSKSWPGEETILALIAHASELPIWTISTCHFILQRAPEQRLEPVLTGSSQDSAEADLDELYWKSLLNHVAAQQESDSEFYSTFCQILGVIAVVQNPLSSQTIDCLLELDMPSEDTINSLKPSLCIGENAVVHPVYPSFIEFLSNKDHCQDCQIFIDVTLYHEQLAQYYLTSMKDISKNICPLDSSVRFNNEIEDIEELSKVNVPEDLHYACNFWQITSLTQHQATSCILLSGILTLHTYYIS
jgi:hypothetical protein